MAKFSENIILPKALIKKGVAILPLEEWEKIKEDLEMFQSKKLLKEIEKAREEAKEGKTISLKEEGKWGQLYFVKLWLKKFTSF